MDLKFYLNKFVKADNIEGYTLSTLNQLRKIHDEFLDSSEGIDPDFPGLTLGDHGGGEKISKGTNAYSIFGGEENIPKDYKGITGDRLILEK